MVIKRGNEPWADIPEVPYFHLLTNIRQLALPAATVPATGRQTPPIALDAHRLADTLARALPPLSNRTLNSLLRRLDGNDAIDAAARVALRVLHGRPDDQARAAAERRHHDHAFRTAIAQQQAGRAAERSTYGWIRPVQSSRKLCMKLYTAAAEVL